MCEKCGKIDSGHREDNCPNPPDPNISSKLAQHKKLCNDLCKRAVCERINKASSGGQSLPAPALLHTAQLATTSILEIFDEKDPASSLYSDFNDFADDDSWIPDRCYFALCTPTSPSSLGPVSMLLLIGTLGITLPLWQPSSQALLDFPALYHLRLTC
jgi:hypothetical protein